MNSNSLKLNDSKSELILFGSKPNLAKIQSFDITMLDSVISPSQNCRNLGVMLNSSMSMSTHVSSICKSVRYQLRNLGFIRKYLTRSTTEKLVHALISSRLDFCNSMLHQLPNTQLARLQKLQNTAARIVTLSSRRTHITPILKTLHWLPVRDRIIFKLLLLVFRSLHGSAPDYNRRLIVEYKPTRRLRSSDSFLLVVPQTRTSWGDRSFSHSGPYLWNKLPLSIRSLPALSDFKTALKTHLFLHSAL